MAVNRYFEINDYSVDRFGGKYRVIYDYDHNNVVVFSKALTLLMHCDRAWDVSNDRGVVSIKNRSGELNDLVIDEKELFWIKLQAIKV